MVDDIFLNASTRKFPRILLSNGRTSGHSMNFTSKISSPPRLYQLFFLDSSFFTSKRIRIQDLLHLKVYAFLFLGIEEMPSNGYMKILGINRYDD